MNKYLSELKTNQIGEVLEIDKCCHANKRLSELGIYKGAYVKMIKNNSGPVIICLRGNKLALGKGIASHIIVKI